VVPLGDRDLALHIARTRRLRAGGRLTDVVPGPAAIARRRARILPMADEPVADRGPDRRRLARVPGVLRAPPAGADVRELRFAGVEAAGRTPEVARAQLPPPTRSSCARPTRSSRSARSSPCRGSGEAIAAARRAASLSSP
jgi:LPPG:FO 2-phospho-L-lactate transferase